MRIMGDGMNLLKRREATNCDVEIVSRKVGDAQGDIINFVTVLHRKPVSMDDSVCCGVIRAFVEVSRRLKEVSICKA